MVIIQRLWSRDTPYAGDTSTGSNLDPKALPLCGTTLLGLTRPYSDRPQCASETYEEARAQ